MFRMQRALARLYLDASLRDRLYAGDASAKAEIDLDGEEAEQLHAFVVTNRASLERFARVVLRKRASEVAAAFPLTSTLLGGDYWSKSCETFLRRAGFKALDDLPRFAKFLSEDGGWRRAEFKDLLYMELAIATLERANISVPTEPVVSTGLYRPRLSMQAKVATISFEPAQLRAWALSNASTCLSVRPVSLLLFRESARYQRVTVCKIAPMHAALLSCCDGKADVAEILRKLCSSEEDARLISAALRAYADAGILTTSYLDPKG